MTDDLRAVARLDPVNQELERAMVPLLPWQRTFLERIVSGKRLVLITGRRRPDKPHTIRLAEMRRQLFPDD